MKILIRAVVFAITGFAVSAFAAGSAGSEAISAIAGPQTSGEHQRLGELYTQKALALESDADWHERMPRLYAIATKGAPGTQAHCRALHDKLAAEAKAARAEALEQFKLAAAVGK